MPNSRLVWSSWDVLRGIRVAGFARAVRNSTHGWPRLKMATYLQRERRRRIAVWIAVVLTTCAALAFSYWLVGPPPPKKIRLATGDPDGAYASFGQMYADILRKNGPETRILLLAAGVNQRYPAARQLGRAVCLTRHWGGHRF